MKRLGIMKIVQFICLFMIHEHDLFLNMREEEIIQEAPIRTNYSGKYRSRVNDKLVFDKQYLVEGPVYNRNLKDIAKLAGIQKNITNKVARHTNAQLWISYGAEGAVLSKMMGHTKQETTRNYYDVNVPEIVEGTKRVDFKAMGI